MMVFVIFFYSLLFLADVATKRNSAHPPAGSAPTKASVEKSIGRMTVGELKAREDLFKKNLEKRPRLTMALSLVFLSILAAGFILNLYFLVRKKRRFWGESPSLSSEGSVPWGIKEVVHVFIFLFFAEAVILFIEVVLAVFFHVKNLEKDLVLILNSLVRDVLVAAFVIFLVKKHFHKPLSEIGLTVKGLFKNIARGFMCYLAVIPALFTVLFVIAALAQTFSYEPPPQPVVEIYLKESSEKYLTFFTLFVAVVGPAIEEIFFRGFAYKGLRERLGVRRAMIGSAAIFAALHMNLVAFFPIFLLGLYLAYLYEKSGSLVPSMTVHMVHNLAMVLLTLGFKSLST